MMRTLRSAMVIARRDYIATVWSKTFLIFLIGPMLPLIFAGVASLLADKGSDQPEGRDAVAIVMPARDAQMIANAQAQLAQRLGNQIPSFDRHAPAPGQAVLDGTLDQPHLTGSSEAIQDLTGPIGLILDRASTDRALGKAVPAPVKLETTAFHSQEHGGDRSKIAMPAEFVLFFITFLIASMLVSNLVEEKANKIIELLASAVPVDAIFIGKLVAMLGATLTGMVVWASCAAVGIEVFVTAGSVPTPAVGWPIFLGLGLIYFIMLFLLWGVIYLGVGAQAGSAREAQTLAMPLSLAQALVFTFASSQASHPDRPIALIAAVFPWSSPFAMLARAAILPALWPHLAALALQFITLLVAVRLGARLFRTNILKTGRPTRQPKGIARLFRR